MKNVLAALLILSALPAAAQSLGQVARKDKERRANAQAKGTRPASCTDADLATTKGRLANDPGLPAAGGASAPAASDSPASDGPALAEGPAGARDAAEFTWRRRAQQVRTRLACAQRRYDSVKDLV